MTVEVAGPAIRRPRTLADLLSPAPAGPVEPRPVRYAVRVRVVYQGQLRRLGPAVAEAVVSDVDAGKARAAALAHLRAYAAQRRVRVGAAAVTMTRLDPQTGGAG